MLRFGGHFDQQQQHRPPPQLRAPEVELTPSQSLRVAITEYLEQQRLAKQQQRMVQTVGTDLGRQCRIMGGKGNGSECRDAEMGVEGQDGGGKGVVPLGKSGRGSGTQMSSLRGGRRGV